MEQRMSRTTMNNVKAFDLEITCENLTILHGDNDKIETYLDGNLDMSLLANKSLVSGILLDNINYEGHDVTIKFPRNRLYKEGYISLLLNTKKCIIGKQNDGFVCKTISIDTKNSEIDIYAFSDTLEIYGEHSNINLLGHFPNLDVKVDDGHINVDYLNIQTDHVNFTCFTEHGDIRCNLKDLDVKYFISKATKHNNISKTYGCYYTNNIKVDLFLLTCHGELNILSE